MDSETCPLHGRRSTHGDDATESAEEVLIRERDEARAERDALRAELAAERAIVEGRTTLPTPAEIAAHPGPWLVQYSDGGYDVLTERAALRYVSTLVGPPLRPVRWWPLEEVPRG